MCQVTPRMLLTILLVDRCKFPLIPQSCHFLGESDDQRIIVDCLFSGKKSICVLPYQKNVENQLYRTISSVLKVYYNTSELTIVSLVLSFLLLIPFPAGNIIVYTSNQSTNREKYSYKLQHQSQKADSSGK